MTPVNLSRLAELQQREREGLLGDETKLELYELRRELAASPEVADDPKTWLVDESRRPNLDGSDWNEMNRAKCRDEVEGFLKSLATKYGPAVLQAVVAGLKG